MQSPFGLCLLLVLSGFDFFKLLRNISFISSVIFIVFFSQHNITSLVFSLPGLNITTVNNVGSKVNGQWPMGNIKFTQPSSASYIKSGSCDILPFTPNSPQWTQGSHTEIINQNLGCSVLNYFALTSIVVFVCRLKAYCYCSQFSMNKKLK